MLLALPAVCGLDARAEPVSSDTVGSIGESGGPLRDVSGSVGETSSGGVRSGGLESSGGVRDSSVGGMLSGPVRQGNAGSAMSGQPVYGDGGIGSASSGAVKQPPNLPPLRMSRPVSAAELQQLGEQLRAIQPLPEDEN